MERNFVHMLSSKRMCQLHGAGVRKQMIVDPGSEHGCFHCRCLRLRKCLDPHVQIQACCRNRAFSVDMAAAIVRRASRQLFPV
jgi:hypothetical protein